MAPTLGQHPFHFPSIPGGRLIKSCTSSSCITRTVAEAVSINTTPCIDPKKRWFCVCVCVNYYIIDSGGKVRVIIATSISCDGGKTHWSGGAVIHVTHYLVIPWREDARISRRGKPRGWFLRNARKFESSEASGPSGFRYFHSENQCLCLWFVCYMLTVLYWLSFVCVVKFYLCAT